MSARHPRPAGKLGPVVVKDGHLFSGNQRLRLVGVNLCFGANFPTHDDAEKVAARMAKFGINAVRFHHMDMNVTPNGIWARDRKTLDATQLDKLDYFFAQLKKNGIYGDLNLHVSRTYPDRPSWSGMPSFQKGVDNFDPVMGVLQRDYARELLTHRNPYTGMCYADDPAVAIVEINNENALTHEWFSSKLDAMPPVYSNELQHRWNAWLEGRYHDHDALRKAWGASNETIGSELIANGTFVRGTSGWTIERHEEATAEVKLVADGGTTALTVRVPRPAKEGWHVQAVYPGLHVEAGRPYTLTFKARADAPRRISVNLMQAHPGYLELWSGHVELTRAWTTFTMTVQPSNSDANARVSFTGLGTSTGTVSLAEVSLRPGGSLGLEKGERLGAIAWFKKGKFTERTVEAQRDWLRFLLDVETGYWTGMARYLKDELKLKAPVVGTPMGWSAACVQSKLDVIDSHAYWQHPRFPNRPWDAEDWVVKNLPMAGRDDGGTLPGLALSRVAGKPFLCTEYNHSAPNTYAAETLPLIFGFAAMQDWDGVFLFAYSHRHDEWDTGALSSFFDVDQDPVKMVTFPAAAALFARGDVPTGPPTVALADPDQTIEALRKRGPSFGADAYGLTRASALLGPVAQAVPSLSLGSTDALTPRSAGGSRAWSWRSESGQGVVTIDAPRSKLLISGAGPARYRLGDVEIAPNANSQNWSVITVTAIDGPDFHSPGRILVTATGQVENTGMAWKDATHTSVGRAWGHRPSRVEGISATVGFAVGRARLHAWALDERGQRRDSAPVIGREGQSTVFLTPEQKTLWYEVEIAN